MRSKVINKMLNETPLETRVKVTIQAHFLREHNGTTEECREKAEPLINAVLKDIERWKTDGCPMIHTTIGLYLNGSFKMNGVKAEHLADHIEYNKKYRQGRALFVDGKCEYVGHLSNKEIQAFEKRIKQEMLIADKCTMPYQ